VSRPAHTPGPWRALREAAEDAADAMLYHEEECAACGDTEPHPVRCSEGERLWRALDAALAALAKAETVLPVNNNK